MAMMIPYTIGSRAWRGARALLAVTLLVSCDDSLTQLSPEPVPAVLDIVSGDDQTGSVGAELPEPLVVRVLDEAGMPLSNQIVNFLVTEGGGTVFAGTALTDSDGTARELWTLGPTAGSPQAVEARAVDAETGDRLVFAVFTATAIDPAGVVASVEVAPTSAELTVGDTRQLTATARNASGGTVTGRSFTWASSDTDVATVSGAGVVTGRAPGTAAISAEVDGEVGSMEVTVTDPSEPPVGLANECASPQNGWIWCDDFEQDRLGQYFEYDDSDGSFGRLADVGVDNSTGLRALFEQGDVSAGSLKVAFGRTPAAYFEPVDDGAVDYRDLYFRFLFRYPSDWTGGGGVKMARATIIAGSNWSQAMIAHLWSDLTGEPSQDHLVIDPASGTDAAGNLRTTQYNDFSNLRWLGSRDSSTPIFDSDHVGGWHCVESRVRLNDEGQSNGVFQLWIDGVAEASRTDLNWVGAYDAYGINAFFLENYWNDGAPRQQERYFDNLVVSTTRIGCGG